MIRRSFIISACILISSGCASITRQVRTFAEDVAAVRSHVVVRADDPDREKWEKALDAVGKTADLIAHEIPVGE